MARGSSERLVDRGAKKKENVREALTRYITLLLVGLVGTGGCALLFLVPLYADPALSALAADFDPLPVECVTEHREDRHGLDNCTWGASCREGCTGDVYRCMRLHVRYKREDWVQAVLYVNIKGCGYPPQVDCENFTTSYAYKGARYSCYFSHADPRVVVPQWSRGDQVTMVTRTLALPLCVAACAGIGLCALHCECSPRRRRRPPRRPPRLPVPPADGETVYRLA